MTEYSDKPWLEWYDDHVAAEIALPEFTLPDAFDAGLRANPAKPAFHFLGSTCTYRQLDELSDRFARFLVDGGCSRGDVVGIHLPNVPQYLVALVGAAKAGCVITGVSPLLAPGELVHQLNDSGAAVLITLDSLFEERILGIADKVPGLRHIVVTNVADHLPAFKRVLGTLLKKIPSGKAAPVDGKTVTTYRQLVKDSPAERPRVEGLSPDDTCLLAYTGGTTGRSKGTVYTHECAVSVLSQIGNWLNPSYDSGSTILEAPKGDDLMCSGFPFFHGAGTIFGSLAIAMGNTQVLIPDPRNTDHICAEMKKYPPTQLGNVPTLYGLLMDNPEFATIDFSSVKMCISGAAPFDVDSIKRLESFVGDGKVVEIYGMTEAFISMNPVRGKNKIGSVGVPVHSTEVRIVSVEDLTSVVPLGEAGELVVRCPQAMKGYHNNPQATEDAFIDLPDGRFMRTGDVAKMDDDGFLFILDRTKDMLLVGGYNVYSLEVEDVVAEMPEVELCAVIGEPNPDRPGSEIVKLVIQRPASGAELDESALTEKVEEHCRDNLAPYKVPKIVEFVDAIPLTSVGKVDKKAMRS